MSARKTVPWTVLSDDDSGNSAITVPAEDTNVIEALQELVCQVTGDQYELDNHALVKAAEGLKVEWWTSVTQRMAEAEGIDLDNYGDSYYMPGGDGKRGVWIVPIETSGWVLGELCDEALVDA